jgi:two-component system, sensor histidine kinase YesM
MYTIRKIGVHSMRKLINYLQNLSVRWKFVLAYFAILIVPVIFSGVYMYLKTSDSAINQAKLVMEQNLMQTRASILQKVTLIENVSKIVTSYNNVQTIFKNEYENEEYRIIDYQFEASPFIENILRISNSIYSIRFYMPDTIITEMADSYYSVNRVEAPEWYKEIAERKKEQKGWIDAHEAVMNALRPDNHTIEQVFSYNSGINFTISRSELGQLGIEIKESVLFDVLRDPVIRKFGKVFVIDGEGTTVSNNMPEYFRRNVKNSNFPGYIGNKKINEVERVNGKDFIVISIPIENIRCSIVGIFPVDNFNGEVKSSLTSIIFVLIISSLLLAGVIYIITNLLLGRIKKLVRAIKQVKEGNLDVSVNVTSTDEFGEMASSFNHMTRRIHELVETVYKIQLMEREAELKALEAQINPHFLYNTLATVSWVARKANVPEIVKISNSLAKFYRLVLSKGERMIFVREELDMLTSYLNIQKIRFEYMFDVNYLIDEGIYDFKVAKNILQPLVENALHHGVEPKGTHGTITIKAKEWENKLLFQIIDDGIGMGPETLKSILEGKVERSNGSGYAIKNIIERLKVYYGDEQKVTIFSKIGIGTVITITLAKI